MTKLNDYHTKHIERIGEININHQGCEMKIIEYNNSNNIVVEFQDKYRANIITNYHAFCCGSVNNPYFPTVFGVGYLGQGKYKGFIGHNEAKIEYKYWHSMMRRCYSKLYIEKTPSYKTCYVCDEWHNFQNFAKWFDENYYEVDDCYKMNLDKDIIQNGNRIYCPEFCCFIPNNINMLFRPEDLKKKNNLPGAKRIKNSTKYEANICKNGRRVYIGTFDTEYEAYMAYVNEKEKYIKIIAEKYKNHIPHQIYSIMINYKITPIEQ